MTAIRVATKLDREIIREVHLHAFSENENQMVSALAVNLLNEETTPETISLVAEDDGAVVGHIAYSPVFVDGNPCWRGYILAPLGVKLEYQNARVGTKLVEAGMQRLSQIGVNVVFVYGDPKYYGRFGFKVDLACGYAPPYELEYPFGWQAMALREGGFGESTGKLSCVASLRDPKLW